MADNVVDEARVVVRPDTSNFARELKAKLKEVNEDLEVKATVNLDTTKAKTALEEFSRKDATVTANVKPETGKASAALGAWGVKQSGKLDIKPSVSPKTAKATATLKGWSVKQSGTLDIKPAVSPKTTKASAELAAWRARESRKSININVNASNLRRASAGFFSLRGVGRSLTKTFSNVVSVFTSIGKTAVTSSTEAVGGFTQMGSALGEMGTEAVSTSSKAAGGFTKMGSAAVTGIGAGVGAGLQLLKTGLQIALVWGGMTSLFVTIAGAVAALSGAVVTLSAAVPALAFGLGAGIGSVLLGLDGIKKAAASIKPEFEALKKSVSETFTNVLTPQFKQLTQFFPLLRNGSTQVAFGISQISQSMINMLKSKQGIADLRGIFQQMGQFLTNLSGPLSNFVGTLLHIGAANAAWKFLSDLLSGILNKLSKLFARLQNTGLLSQAFKGLNSILQAAVQFIVTFAYHSTQFLTGAAPGLTKFFQGLTTFLGKFDWQWLGSVFGSTFGAIGDAFAKIPQQTIKDFQNAISYVADTIRHFVESGALNTFIEGLGYLMTGFANVIKIIQVFIDAIHAILHPLDTAKGFAKDVTDGLLSLGNQFGLVGDDAVNGTNKANGAGRGSKNVFKDVSNSIFRDLQHAGRDGGQTFAKGIGSGKERSRAEAEKTRQILISTMNVDLFGSGKATMDSFKGGMQSAWGDLKNFVNEIGPWIKQHKGPISYDKRLLIPAGKAIMGGLHSGLLNGFQSVQTLITSMGTAISGGLGAETQGDFAFSGSVSRQLSSEVNATFANNQIYSLPERIAQELGGMQWKIDGQFATIVNRQNREGRRR